MGCSDTPIILTPAIAPVWLCPTCTPTYWLASCLVTWWFDRTQNKALYSIYNSGTGHCCMAGPVTWNSIPLDIRSPHTLSTFKTCSGSIFFHVPTSLTNCFQSTSSEHCTGALVVTLAMLLRLINCRFNIAIIIRHAKTQERQYVSPYYLYVCLSTYLQVGPQK